MKFSVLISIYAKDNPEWLHMALDSIWLKQSLQPSQIVLVIDGVIPESLRIIVDNWDKILGCSLTKISLSINTGLANALNIGLMQCESDVIARMDADDICKPNRFETQVNFLEQNPDIDVIGSWIDEFIENTNNIISQRKVPQSHEEIAEYIKTRCPMNHPTVMFRKSAILDAGNYDKRLRVRQDYELWVRVLAKGYKFANIQESLLYFRTAEDLYKRRGGLKIIKYDYYMQHTLLKYGLISRMTMIKNLILYGSVRIMPNCIRKFVYHRVLR